MSSSHFTTNPGARLDYICKAKRSSSSSPISVHLLEKRGISILNLTRNVRPYAIIENVVTDIDYRGSQRRKIYESDIYNDDLNRKTVKEFDAEFIT